MTSEIVGRNIWNGNRKRFLLLVIWRRKEKRKERRKKSVLKCQQMYIRDWREREKEMERNRRRRRRFFSSHSKRVAPWKLVYTMKKNTHITNATRFIRLFSYEKHSRRHTVYHNVLESRLSKETTTTTTREDIKLDGKNERAVGDRRIERTVRVLPEEKRYVAVNRESAVSTNEWYLRDRVAFHSIEDLWH